MCIVQLICLLKQKNFQHIIKKSRIDESTGEKPMLILRGKLYIPMG